MRPLLKSRTFFKRFLTTSVVHGIKPLIDIKTIRRNPQSYANDCIHRNWAPLKDYPFKIVEGFNRRRDAQAKALPLRIRGNGIEVEIARLPADGDIETKQGKVKEAADIRKQLAVYEDEIHHCDREIQHLAEALPNTISSETPVGDTWRQLSLLNERLKGITTSGRKWKDHVTLGKEFELIDFDSAANSTGRGWYFLQNEAVRLEQALVAYALDVTEKHGFKALAPPSLAYAHMGDACGFRPRDKNEEQQIYRIAQHERDAGKPELTLTATAEIPFASTLAGETLTANQLPRSIAGASRCFRAEAGARGTDTKGLYRVHEFTKVEMFTWVHPSHALASFDKMLSIQCEILSNLGLHCRVLEMPSHDLGASAHRKIDIEVWFPSRRERKEEGWGEVTSLSNCTDYQTRRLMTRVKLPTAGNAKGGMMFPYTINGTALAVPRVLMALLEYGWDEAEDCIRIPETLWPYMGDRRVIRRKR